MAARRLGRWRGRGHGGRLARHLAGSAAQRAEPLHGCDAFAPAPDQQASVGAPITQLFSDQFGWRELEKKVAAIYRALPPEQRVKAAILAFNYGEAAAVDFYGAADGLPPALSGHNQYFLWGPRGYDGSVIIGVNGKLPRWRQACASLDIAGNFGAPYTMPYENGRIVICRDLRGGLEQAWPKFKFYY